MDTTLEDGRAQIESLRIDLAKYRRLAEERRAAGHLGIADQLVQLIGTIEKRVAELEALEPKDLERAASAEG
jgi:hypothetical protein